MFELIELTPDLAVLRFRGSAAGAELAEIRPQLMGHDVIIDFCGVEFVSSEVLAALIMLHSNASPRKAVLAGLAPDLRNMCAITKIDHLFTLTATVDEGRELLQTR